MRHSILRFGLCLFLLLAAGCADLVPAPAPAPTGIVLLPSPTASSTSRPTYPPAVQGTATALALAALAGNSPTAPAPASTPTTTPARQDTATTAPSPTPSDVADTPTVAPSPSDSPSAVTAGPTRTPIGNATSQTALPPAGCSALHTVEPGEWLTKIAQQYGVALAALEHANKLTDSSPLYPGQVLCIPGTSGAPAPTAANPSATPSPTRAPASGLAILSLTASPNPVDRGAVVQLAWTVRNAVAVTLWPLAYDFVTNQWFRQPTATYSGTGSAELTVAVPLDARGPLRYELEARDAAGGTVTLQTDLIRPVCNPAFFGGPLDPSYCLLPSENAPAEFQRFERGFMIWRSDTGDVFVLTQDPGRATFWLQWIPTGAAVQTGTPPAGEYAPGANFAEVWATLGPADFGGSSALRDLLGWATEPPQTYNLNEQVRLDARYPDFDSLYLGWPDGQVAQMLTGGGIPHTGTIGPAWFLFTPTH
jgi:LysM repeat protein